MVLVLVFVVPGVVLVVIDVRLKENRKSNVFLVLVDVVACHYVYCH